MFSRSADSVLLPLDLTASGAESSHRRARLQDQVTSLFDQFREPLLRYLWSLGLSLPDGEEVLQEVFLSLYQHLDRGKPLDHVRGWLFRVAHNLGLKRRQRVRRATETHTDADHEDLAVDPSPNPEAQLAHSQTKRRLLAVVDALPEQDRRCLYLRAEGLRYREIAGILDMSLGAVPLSLTRSLARIARANDATNPERSNR